MIKQSGKILGVLGLVSLAIIWISYIWEKISIDQGLDYSLKAIISIGILFLVACVVDFISPKIPEVSPKKK